ncbi:MAG: ATPase domain-containing protein, partial [Acidimicrobiales bacterium]
MTRQRSSFYCSACEVSLMQWEGRCPKCGSWNTVEERLTAQAGKPVAERVYPTISELSLLGDLSVNTKLVSGVKDWDWVLGGGITRGSVVLLGGEPGVGKSTLALQVIGTFARQGVRCFYASGEETAEQISARARRLGADGSCALLCDGDVTVLHEAIDQRLAEVIVIDSIQAFSDPLLPLSRYSATYLRTIVEDLGTRAKRAGVTLLLLSQINKEGALLGPKAIEHLVDVVVFFEGDSDSSR